MFRKIEFPPLSKSAKGFSVLAILFLSTILLVLISANHDRIGMHHASLKIVIETTATFLILTAATFLSIILALKNKKNKKVYLFFSTVIVVLHILGIVIAIYLSAKYIEITFIVIFALTILAIISLLGDETEDKV
jgi:uncharacterized membrane protein YfcA